MHFLNRFICLSAVVSTFVSAQESARFRVTPEVINPGLEAFTDTTHLSIGHSSLRNSGHTVEPVHFRFRSLAAFRDSEIAAGRGNEFDGVYRIGPGYSLSDLNVFTGPRGRSHGVSSLLTEYVTRNGDRLHVFEGVKK